MPSKKKAAAHKAARPPRVCNYSKGFLKDWESLSHAGRFDMTRLKAVMLLLIAADQPLGPEWLDHPLKGEWTAHRECHIGGDFLLIYRIELNNIYFVRAGTHAELFDS